MFLKLTFISFFFIPILLCAEDRRDVLDLMSGSVVIHRSAEYNESWSALGLIGSATGIAAEAGLAEFHPRAYRFDEHR